MLGVLVCRACLACNVPVYDILNTQYQNVFERIADISLADHGKPHSLCAPCLETLHKSSRLLEKSKISEGILTRLLQQNELTESSIKAVNRQHHKIADTLPIFNLEPMKRNEEIPKTKDRLSQISKFQEQLSPSLSLLPSNNKDEDIRVSSLVTPELFEKQQLGDTTDKAMVEIEPNQIQSPEDPRDVVVKTEPGETPSSADSVVIIIEPDLTQSSYVTNNIAVKTEPMEMHDVFDEPVNEAFVKEAPNKSDHSDISDHELSVETVKQKETPYIQIDVEKLQQNIKSEVDNDNHETPNISGSLDNDSLLEVYVEMIQPIDSELSEITDDKNKLNQQLHALKSSKGIKEAIIKKCEVDRRRIKTESSSEYKAIAYHDKPKILKEQEQTESYHCNKCDYKTSIKTRLQYHMKKHTGFVMCAICNYKCDTKCRLVSHIRVHTKERPFKCKICYKGFTQMGSLNKHKTTHDGDTPYKCMWCEYKAISRTHLDRHIRRHIGDKRYKCGLCDYAGIQKWDLKTHSKIHENGRVMRCKRVAPVKLVKVEKIQDFIQSEAISFRNNLPVRTYGRRSTQELRGMPPLPPPVSVPVETVSIAEK